MIQNVILSLSCNIKWVVHPEAYGLQGGQFRHSKKANDTYTAPPQYLVLVAGKKHPQAGTFSRYALLETSGYVLIKIKRLVVLFPLKGRLPGLKKICNRGQASKHLKLMGQATLWQPRN